MCNDLDELSQIQQASCCNALEDYEHLLESGAPREQARTVLPVATMTKCVWKMDLNNLLKFLYLRLGEDAQQETREFAKTIAYEFVQPLFPYVWKAFVEYKLNAITISENEWKCLKFALVDYGVNIEELFRHSDNVWAVKLAKKIKKQNLKESK